MPHAAVKTGGVLLSRRQLCLGTAATALGPWAEMSPAQAAETSASSRSIPARQVAVPSTVSPELKQVIGAPYPLGWDVVPATPTAWKELAARSASDVAPHLPLIR